MKAGIYKGISKIEIREIEVDQCGPKDIIVKNLFAGICGTDIYAYRHGGESNYIYEGCEFGHEVVSEIVEVGTEVTDLTVGQRVYPFPIFAKDDQRRSATLGGFSQYMHLPNCTLGKSVFLVDSAISDEVAAMIEPFTVGAHAAKLSSPSTGQNAIVFGAGIIGITTAIALKEMGVNQVIISDIANNRLQKVEELGFIACNSQENDLEQFAKEKFGTVMSSNGPTINADIFVDAVGIHSIPETFQKIAKFNAKLVVVGVHHKPVPIDLRLLTFSQQSIIGSPAYDFQDVHFVMELMKRKGDTLKALVSHKYPLEELNQALQTASNAQESMKVLIQHNR